MNIYFLSFIRSVAFSFSSVLIWQLGWRLSGWLRGSNLLPGPMQSVFTIHLHINSSIDYVCSKHKEKENREVRKTPTRIGEI